MAVRLDKDVRQVVVLRGGSQRRVYDVDRDDDDNDIRITVIRRDENGKERNFSTSTMELSPQDAQRVIVAKQAGRLTALLRHPDDKAANPSGAMDPTVLLSGRVRRANGERQGIEYLVGGGGGPADIKTQLSRLALSGELGAPAAAPAKP